MTAGTDSRAHWFPSASSYRGVGKVDVDGGNGCHRIVKDAGSGGTGAPLGSGYFDRCLTG